MKYKFYSIFFIVFFLILGGSFYFVSNIQAITGPTNFRVENKYACGIELTWKQEGDFNSFQLTPSIKKDDGSWFVGDEFSISKDDENLISSGEGIYYYTYTGSNIKGLSPNTDYKFELETCFTSGGCTEAVSIITTTKGIDPPPPPPTDISTVKWVSNGSGDSLYIIWEPKNVIETATTTSGFRIFSLSDDDLFYIKNTISFDDFINGSREWGDSNPIEGDNFYKLQTYQTGKYCGDVDNGSVDDDKIIFSEDSEILTVPAKPGDITPTESDDNWVFNWPEVTLADKYTFEISIASTTNEDVFLDNKLDIGQEEYTTTLTDPITLLGGESHYYYRVRAYSIDGPREGFSLYSTGDFVAAYESPENLKVRVLNVSDDIATVRLDWEGSSAYEHDVYVHDGVEQQIEVEKICEGSICRYPTYYIDDVPISDIYKYKVSFDYGDGEQKFSNTFSINLNIDSILQGVAWTAYEDSNENSHGIGWIKFNSLSEEGSVPGNESYSVQIDEDGYLSGLAWSGDEYGWFSFNKADLSGCPSGECIASIDSSGDLSGWSRFISAKENSDNNNYWNGWVHLGGNGYGVTKKEDGYFYGSAWADDIGGWIVFGPTIDGTGDTACDVNDGDLTGSTMDKMNVRITTAEGRTNCAGSSKSPSLTLAVQSDSKIQINWNNPIDYNALLIWSKISSAPSFNPDTWFYNENGDNEVKAGSHSYLKTGLEPNTEYTFYIEAEEEEGGSTYLSEEKSATTLEKPVPPPLEAYTIWCYPIDYTSIRINWNGPETEDYDEIKLFIKNYSSSTYVYSTSTDLGEGDYLHTDLDINTTYDYLLEVMDNEGEVATSTKISCTTLIQEKKAPSNLNVWGVSSSTLYINWKDNLVSDHSFTIERIKVTPEISSLNDVELYPKESDFHSFDKLNIFWENNTNDEDEKSPFYHVIERTTSTDIDPFSGIANDPSFTSSMVEFQKDRDYSEDTIDYSFTDTGLDEATTYYYRIKACSYIEVDLNKDGNPEVICSNGYSLVKNNTTAPKKPTDFKAEANTTSTVDLSWDDNSDREDGYKIYRSMSQNGVYDEIVDKGSNVESYHDTGLVPNTTYYYRVIAYKNYEGNFIKSDYAFTSTVTEGMSKIDSKKILANFNKKLMSLFSLKSSDTLLKQEGVFYSNTLEYIKGVFSNFKDFDVLNNKVDINNKLSSSLKNYESGRDIVQKLSNGIGVVVNKLASWFKATASAMNINDYFKQFIRGDLKSEDNPGIYKDTELEPNTVYLYRVKATYGDGNDTAYSNMAGEKTFPVVGENPTATNIGICTRNSFCEFINVIYNGDVIPQSYKQCDKNADCRNVGMMRRILEEQ